VSDTTLISSSSSTRNSPLPRRPSLWRLAGALAALVVVALALSLPMWGLDSYTLAIVYNVAFFTALAQAWNLLSGFTGYISFAHGALAGIGGYAGILAMNDGASFVVSILAGAAAAVLASIVIGLPSLRLRGIAFAFATIFFQAGVLILANKATPITGGSRGLSSQHIMPLEQLLTAMVVVAASATLAVFLLRQSRLGLRMLSIREDETAARTIGIRTVRLKFAAFAISAFFAGAAGAVHGFFLATVFPFNVFDIQTSLEPLVIALIGGAGSAGGPLVMAGVYAVSQEALQSLGSELQLSLLGAILVLVVLFARDGLAGFAVDWRERRERKTDGGS
jgi:branched-chain amino acid transport system permease protein